MRSLAFKLILGFTVVGLIGAGLVALFVRQATIRAFDRLLLDQARARYVDRVAAYYQQQGSWRGILQHLTRERQAPPAAAPAGEQPPPPMIFALANANGRVVVPSGDYRSYRGYRGYRLGERVPASALQRGIPVEVEG